MTNVLVIDFIRIFLYALKKLCDKLNMVSKKLVIACKPRDNVFGNGDKLNKDKLVKLVYEIGCNGLVKVSKQG